MQKNCVLSPKNLKKRVFWGFRLRTRTTRNITVSHRSFSNSQVCCLNGGTRCWNTKEAILSKRKMRFRPKNVKARGVFSIFRSVPERIGLTLYDPDNAQTHRTAVKLKIESAVKVENWIFWKKIFRFWPKNVKKCFFFQFFRSALKRFGIWLCDPDDAQTHRKTVEVDWKRVATVKEGSFREKVAFRSKKRWKNGFFWGFQCLH